MSMCVCVCVWLPVKYQTCTYKKRNRNKLKCYCKIIVQQCVCSLPSSTCGCINTAVALWHNPCPCYCRCYSFAKSTLRAVSNCLQVWLINKVFIQNSPNCKMYLKDVVILQRSCSKQSYLQNVPGIKSFSIFHTGPSCTSFILSWNTMDVITGDHKQCFTTKLLSAHFLHDTWQWKCRRVNWSHSLKSFGQFLTSAAQPQWSQQ